MGDKRVLVAGGAGFLGSRLCEKLLQEGCSVICLDNFSTGEERNIRHLCRDTVHFEVKRRNVGFPLDTDVDEIYNLACPATRLPGDEDPIQAIGTSVTGTLSLLDLARRSGAKLLQISTSPVCTNPVFRPHDWDCYEAGALCAETLCRTYHREYETRTKVARVSSTYGPRMKPVGGGVIATLIIEALLGDDLTIHGTGLQTRSFCYIDDLIDGLTAVMAAPDLVTQPVNLGAFDEYTVM